MKKFALLLTLNILPNAAYAITQTIPSGSVSDGGDVNSVVTQQVYGEANNYTVSGNQQIMSGGLTHNSTINPGGQQNVESGGTSYNTAVQSNAYQFIKGKSYSSSVSKSGSITVNSGGYALELRLHDLVRCRQGGEDEVIAQGEWSFSIPLTVDSLSPVISIESALVKGEMLQEGADGALEKVTQEVELRDITFTATGVSFYTEESSELLDVAAIFADGTEVASNGGGGSRMEDGSWYGSCQWPVPIDVEQVTALRIGETEIPIP